MKGKHTVVLGVIAAANLLLLAGLGYEFFSAKDMVMNRIAKVESSASLEQASHEEQSSDDERKLTGVLADLQRIKERIGYTSAELKHAGEAAQALRRQQEQVAKEMAKQLAAKANSADIDGLREETTNKLAEVQQDSTARIGNVSGEVSGLKQDLVASREDWGRQLVDVKNALSERIARNSSELAELRKKGERDYFEFDIRKNSKQPFNRVADIRLSLLKADAKKQKYNVAILVDDHRLEKKDRTTNEPVQFLVGHDQLRYEVVVNSVDKDRIRGYVGQCAKGQNPVIGNSEIPATVVMNDY